MNTAARQRSQGREVKGVEEMGMTDLQFKSFLKQLIRNIEDAMGSQTREEVEERLEELLKDLKEDLQG